MCRLPIISLDPMKFVQTFAAGLRAEFADAASAPIPEYLGSANARIGGSEPTPISCSASLPPGNSESAPKVHSSAPA
jgi:hypothetical protein